MVLSVRIGSRHAGGGGYCRIPSGHVRHHQRRTTNHADGRGAVSRALLRQQGPTQVSRSSWGLARAMLTILSAGIIVAGYDRRHGGQVYSIPLGGSLHKQSYAIGGSGSTYIYGYCDSYWREGMTEEKGIEFVKGALQEAIKWDGSSGGVIRMVVLTARGAVRHLYLPDSGYAGPGTSSK